MRKTIHRSTLIHPARAGRVGKFRVDILILVLEIVAILGVGVGISVAYDNWTRDAAVVANIEALDQRHAAELTTVQEVVVWSTEPLGFRELDGGTADKTAINEFLKFNAGHKPLRSKPDPTVVGGAKGTANVDESKQTPSLIGEITQGDAYYKDANSSLRKLIATQDKFINDLIGNLRGLATVRRAEQGFRREAITQRREDITAKSAAHENDVRRHESELRNKTQQEETALNGEASAMKEANVALDSAYTTVEKARREVEVQRRDLALPVLDSNVVREKALDILSRRANVRAAEQDDDGTVVLVDSDSGWVWIDLGQTQNVRKEMTFFVRRLSPTGQGKRVIATLRVKEVMEGGMSRCRIDVLNSQDELPRPGDGVFNSGFTSRPYLVYSFVGRFGGGATRFSRQQLREFLQRFDRVVEEQPSDAVEVIVLGDGFEQDPVWVDLLKRGVRFETMTEKDILYQFGVTGPDK